MSEYERSKYVFVKCDYGILLCSIANGLIIHPTCYEIIIRMVILFCCCFVLEFTRLLHGLSFIGAAESIDVIIESCPNLTGQFLETAQQKLFLARLKR